jgi:hypothetical protein
MVNQKSSEVPGFFNVNNYFQGNSGIWSSGANTTPTSPCPVWAPKTGEIEQSSSHSQEKRFSISW